MNVIDGGYGDFHVFWWDVVFESGEDLDQVGISSVDWGSDDFDLTELF